MAEIETIADALEAAIRAIRPVKEDTVRRRTDTAAFLHCYRAGETVALIGVMARNRDDLVKAAKIAAAGFGADVMSVVHDTYIAVDPVNPLTGRLWETGEMAQAVKKHHALERGWVTDALVVIVVNRAGDVAMSDLWYRVDHQRRVEWGKRRDLNSADGGAIGGYVGDAVMKAMRDPASDQMLHRIGGYRDLGEHARDHLDCMAVEHFRMARVSVTVRLHAEPGSTRAKIIQERLGDAGSWSS